MTFQIATQLNIEIDRNTTHVYYCRYDQIDEPQLLNQYHSLLNQAERQRWEGIRTEDSKQCFLVSRAMIRSLLGTVIDCPPSALTITADARGKPFIVQPTTRWKFNLSHSHGLITLVLAYDAAVGVDIEYHHRSIEALQLARHFFHSREIQQLESLPANEQQQHFFKLWTLKEAYVKAIGKGLSHRLDKFSFTFQPANPRITMSPLPQSAISCWSAILGAEHTMAIIALSQLSALQCLNLYEYIPYHCCTPRQLDTLIHSNITTSQIVPD